VKSLEKRGTLPQLDLMATDNVTGAVAAARQLLAALYDPHNTFKDDHANLNTLRVDQLPPSVQSQVSVRSTS
jgi:hypothetical protein